MSNFFGELKRRNVFRVAIAYAVVAWVVAQIVELAADSFGAPDWVMKMFIVFLAVGFPLALFFSWAFEITPEGLKREEDIDRSKSITPTTGRRIDIIIVGTLVIALSYFIWESRFSEQQERSQVVETATPSTVTSDLISIAVLPFVNMSEDASNVYFSDGISEEILNALARIPGLKVAARTSSFQFKGMSADVGDIAEQLKVENIPLNWRTSGAVVAT